MPDPLLGEVLDGRFRLDQLLGEGGMGRVYLATQLSVDRRVAVKVMLEQAASHPTFRERFLREARVVASFTHASIVRLIDFGEDRRLNLLYLVMDYVEGIPLSGLIERGQVGWQHALRIAAHIALGLSDAHTNGIVHRDLKPDNVMLSVSSDGFVQPLILDFGVALPTDSGVTKLTEDGSIFGTPGFMAPEQARSQEVGPPADLYALGGILFELMSGRLPFEAPSAMAMILDKVHNPAPRLASVLPPRAIPDPVGSFVDALLAQDPRQRPASAKTVVADIERLLGSGDFSLRTGPPPDPFARWFASTATQTAPPSTPTMVETTLPALPATLPLGSPEVPAPQAQPPAPVPTGAASTLVTVVMGLVVGLAAVGAILFFTADDGEAPAQPEQIPPAIDQPPPVASVSPAEADVRRDILSPDAESARDGGASDAEAKKGCGAALEQKGALTLRPETGGPSARYQVYVPEKYDHNESHRILLLLHKGNRNGAHAIKTRGFIPIAEREGLIIVAPTAPGGSWQDSDRTIILGALDDARGRFCVDHRWLFGVGIGSGEEMLEHLVASGLPLSAIAGDGYRPEKGWRPGESPAVPFLHTFGTRSPFVPRDGGLSQCNAKTVVPLIGKVNYWRGINGCTGDAKVYRKPPHGQCFTWKCDKAPFVLCEVDGAREWIDEPPDRNLNPFCVYDPTTKFQHAEEMWRFLAAEGRPLDSAANPDR